ncbi:DUF1365 domain-containing protein [Hyphomonas sp.]|uniref:DUF1365 domain-containing protein n=1 Tax=Hyphomonas sp. TaxID=87 RepID=UPI003919ADA1
MNAPSLQLWLGQTVHERYTPFRRRFRYRIALVDLDIDRLEEAGRVTPLFRVGRPGLFSFRAEDHGPKRKGASLRQWAEELFAGAGIDLGGGPIRLVSFPRHLFFKFAPISTWYGYDRSGSLGGVIYEVNNTFGERHCYVARTDSPRARHAADKQFHVSPFFDVTGMYRFTLRAPEEKMSLMVESLENGERVHMASITARREDARAWPLVSLAVTQPLSSLGVVAAIHWQALRIWLKGAGYRRKPSPPKSVATYASPLPAPDTKNTGASHG